jgi:hypothetical protein
LSKHASFSRIAAGFRIAGLCRTETRPADRSKAYFNEAERLDPRNVNLLRSRRLPISLFAFPKSQLDQVLNITPDDVDTLVTMATIAQAGDLPRAAALLLRSTRAPTTRGLLTQVYQGNP